MNTFLSTTKCGKVVLHNTLTATPDGIPCLRDITHSICPHINDCHATVPHMIKTGWTKWSEHAQHAQPCIVSVCLYFNSSFSIWLLALSCVCNHFIYTLPCTSQSCAWCYTHMVRCGVPCIYLARKPEATQCLVQLVSILFTPHLHRAIWIWSTFANQFHVIYLLMWH